VPLFLKLQRQEAARSAAAVGAYVDALERGALPRRVFAPPLLSGVMLDASGAAVAATAAAVQSRVAGAKRVCIEVCAGNGEWLVARAAAPDASPSTLWMALEMRHDRALAICARAAMARTEGVLVLRGEARAALRDCVPAASAASVYVNFPNPPLWSGSRSRLVAEPFLREAARVLRRGGTLTVVTDNAEYAALIAVDVGAVRDVFDTAAAGTDGGGDGRVFSGEVPPDYGSSYFDRFWTNGERASRFFCVLTRRR
jgi:tRNA G46 methylase TrmB